MHSLDELLVTWRTDPSRDRTVALCQRIAEDSMAPGRDAQALEVAATAGARYFDDPPVLVRIGWMCLRTGLLAEAQDALVQAGRANTHDPEPFRLLGEVLLRRGDAARAQRVLRRAWELDPADQASAHWCERAAYLVALQEADGMAAVAAEVARLLPPSASSRAPRLDRALESPASDTRSEDEDDATRVRAWAPEVAAAPGPRVAYGSIEAEVTPFMRPSERARVDVSAPSSRAVASTTSPALILDYFAQLGWTAPGPTSTASGPLSARPSLRTPPRSHAARLWAAGVLLAVLSAVLIFTRVSALRRDRTRLAQALTEQAVRMLDSPSLEDQRASDQLLRRIMELDPDGLHTRALWLKNRVLYSLLRNPGSATLPAAIERSRELGAKEQDLAYARIASSLASEDLAGALAHVARWDHAAGGDALFQMTAGAALAEAGDPRAVARLRSAVSLAPELGAAQVLLATTLLYEQGAEPSRAIVETLAGKIGDRPTARALKSLLWAVGRDPDAPLPKGAAPDEQSVADLPRPLAPVPFMVRALRQAGAHDAAGARSTIEAALATEPVSAARVELAFTALLVADQGLSRRATVMALSQSPAHPRALELAAYHHALAGEFAQAARATGLLDPARPMSLALRAILAYENGDSQALGRVHPALAEAAERAPLLRALTHAFQILTASPTAPNAAPLRPETGQLWSDLLAMDAALDAGSLALAERLCRDWSQEIAKQQPYLLRRARLERYRSGLKPALELSSAALARGTLTPRLGLERVLALFEAGDAGTALEFARQQQALPGVGPWLTVLALARSGRVEEAQAVAGKQPLPGDAAVPIRAAVARALAAARDPRAAGFIAAQLGILPQHPDLVRARTEYQP